MSRTLQLNRQSETGESGVTTWVDLDLDDPESMSWIASQADLPAHLVQHFQQPADFSRRETIGDGLYVCFHNRGRNSEDRKSTVPSIQLWIEKDRVITATSGRAQGCEALFNAVSTYPDSWSPFEIVSFLIRNDLNQLEPTISQYIGELGQFEDRFIEDQDTIDEEEATRIGQTVLGTRRNLVEIRNLLNFILADDSLPISSAERKSLVTAQNHLQSYMEGIDDCRERWLLLQNQIDSRRADRFNRNAQHMTILATVFLPLSFLTGLLGMNVAGIPDEHNPYGFVIVCLTMVAIAIAFWLFLTKRWS